MKMKIWVVLLMGAFLVGCTTYYPPTISTTSLYSDREIPVKVVTGKSYSTVLLGFLEIEGNNSVSEALKRAKAKEDGDTLVNVFVDRTTTHIPFTWLPIITINTTTVTGTLIRYEGLPRKSKDTPKTKEQKEPVKSILEQ